jgi:hypothetical protein
VSIFVDDSHLDQDNARDEDDEGCPAKRRDLGGFRV